MSWTNIQVPKNWKGWEEERKQKTLRDYIDEDKREDNQ